MEHVGLTMENWWFNGDQATLKASANGIDFDESSPNDDLMGNYRDIIWMNYSDLAVASLE